jgi:O-antigen/teichoic acid export membrane protein
MSTLFGTGATVAITIAQAFILIPLCLTYLGAGLYGAWLATAELLIWLQLLDLGIPNLMTQRIGASAGENDVAAVSRWSGTGLWVLGVIALALAGLAILCAPLVTAWARVPASDAGAFTASFRVGAVASAMLLGYHGVLGIARGVQITGLVNAAQVTAALSGLFVSVGLLLAGFGVWSLAFGLLARAVVSVGAATLFMITARKAAGVRPGRPSVAVLREMAALAPSMAGANAGYLLANYTEVILVNTMFGPVAAAVYALTRRAIDGVRSLLESIAWAVYGGFAQLVTADDRHRARAVLHEILWFRLSAACLCAAVVLGVNQAFVTLLFGAENFGGILLTAGFAVQMIVGGQAFLSNYLFRAAGHVREGSILLAGEAVGRVAAVAGALAVTGLAGAPWAAAGVSAIATSVTLRRLERELPASAAPASRTTVGSRLAPYVVFLLGAAVAIVTVPLSWTYVGGVVVLLTVCSLAVFWWVVPRNVAEGSLMRWIRA